MNKRTKELMERILWMQKVLAEEKLSINQQTEILNRIKGLSEELNR